MGQLVGKVEVVGVCLYGGGFGNIIAVVGTGDTSL